MMSRAKVLQACALAVLVLATACAGGAATSTDVRQIVSATSFGMCVGYCTTRLEISEGRAVLVREGRGGRGAPDLPEQRISRTLTPEEWGDIARLAAGANLAGLPPVIGCPDCADGGAESLTIERSGGSQSVTIDAGGDLEQAQPLLDRLRALRTNMTPE